MAEQAATVGARHGDAPEAAAVDTRNAVVAREPLVEERVVGRQQLGERAIVAQLAADEQLGLAPERLAQVLVELREQIRIRARRS